MASIAANTDIHTIFPVLDTPAKFCYYRSLTTATASSMKIYNTN